MQGILFSTILVLAAIALCHGASMNFPLSTAACHLEFRESYDAHVISRSSLTAKPNPLSILLGLRGGSDETRVKHISSVAAFDAEIAAAGMSLVVVDFSATWCGPCKMIAPVYDELSNSEEFAKVVFLKVSAATAREALIMSYQQFMTYRLLHLNPAFSGILLLEKVDVDETPEIAARYQVMAMPTFLFIKKSLVTDRFSGASIDKLRATITNLK